MNIKKGTLKIIWAYVVALVLFVILLNPFMGLINEYHKWLPIFSLFFFLLMALFIFVEMRKLARAEKRDTVGSVSFPLKGLIYGAIATIPLFILEILFFALRFSDPIYERIKELIFKALIGPLFRVARIGNLTVAAYLVVLLVLPLLATLFYMSGYYNVPAAKTEKLEQSSAAFKKSPWNPSVSSKPSKKKPGKDKNTGR